MPARTTDLLARADEAQLFPIALNASAVTVHDTNALTTPYRFLYVGATGNVKVTTVGGADITFTNVPVGYLWVSVIRVWSTGTTVSTPNTNIIGMY